MDYRDLAPNEVNVWRFPQDIARKTSFNSLRQTCDATIIVRQIDGCTVSANRPEIRDIRHVNHLELAREIQRTGVKSFTSN